jgi:hydroxymethylglutaryl-CoA lyase
MTRIYFNDVVTRDGFQSEPNFIPTSKKIKLINALAHCGFAKIEATEVMAGIERVPGVEYTVLVPNLKGAERAMAAKADELNLVMSVSETHNMSNLRMTRDQSVEALTEVIRFVDGRTPINVSLSTSFGCPMEGDVPFGEVIRFAKTFAALGVRGLTICDTTGMANPRQVSELIDTLRHALDAGSFTTELTLHFHNTRGMGLANLLAAVQSGIVRFDGSLGGLGGCPYAPGATGNISSEDAIHMLESMGYDTGINLPKLIELARTLPGIVGHDVPGQVAKAGRSCDLHPKVVQ